MAQRYFKYVGHGGNAAPFTTVLGLRFDRGQATPVPAYLCPKFAENFHFTECDADGNVPGAEPPKRVHWRHRRAAEEAAAAAMAPVEPVEEVA